MKKIIAIVLGCLIALGLAVPALAAYTGPQNRTVTSTYRYWWIFDTCYDANPNSWCGVAVVWSPPPESIPITGACNEFSATDGFTCAQYDFVYHNPHPASAFRMEEYTGTQTTTYPPATVAGTTGCALPGDNGWCRGGATLALSAQEPITGQVITGIESGSGMLCSGNTATLNCNWNGFSQGITNLSFWALSSWGDSSTMASATLMLDSLPPTLTLYHPAPDGSNGWHISPLSVTASGSDPVSGISGFQYRLDGGAWQAGSQLVLDSDGAHSLGFQARDLAGNTTTAIRSIRLDQTDPLITLAIPPADGQNGWHGSDVIISASATDSTSGIATSGVSLDGITWTSSLILSDGIHTVQGCATDNAGHMAATSTVIRIDSRPPVVWLDIPSPEGSNGWHIRPVTVFAMASDELSGISSAQVSVDGWNWEGTLTLEDGSYLLQGQAMDLAGNTATTSASLQVDATPPLANLSVSGTPGEGGWLVDASIRLDAQASDTTSGIASIRYRADGGAWQDDPQYVLPDGLHTIETQASDQAGNIAFSSTSIRIDITPPTANLSASGISGSNGWLTDGSIILDAQADDLTSGIDQVRYRVEGGDWQASPLMDLPDGIHAIEASVSDHAGLTAIAFTNIQIDSTPPTLSVSIPAVDGQEGWYVTLPLVSLTASDITSGVAATEIRLDGGAWLSTDVCTIPDGRHALDIRVRDQAGNQMLETYSLNVDSQPPHSTFTSPIEGSTTILAGLAAFHGTSLETVSGLAGVEFSLDGGGLWQPLDVDESGTWEFSWDTSTVPDGTYTLLVRARDLAGNREETAMIRVIVANARPQVALPERWYLWEMAPLTIQPGSAPLQGVRITVQDPSGLHPDRVYEYTAGNWPATFQWDGRFGDGAYASEPGEYPVLLEVWDGYGNSARASGLVMIFPGVPTTSATPTEIVNVPMPTIVAASATPEPTAAPTPVSVPAREQPQEAGTIQAAAPGTARHDSGILLSLLGLIGFLGVLASNHLSDPRPFALGMLRRTLDGIFIEGNNEYPNHDTGEQHD